MDNINNMIKSHDCDVSCSADCQTQQTGGRSRSMDNDSYRSNEEFDYGYAQHVSDDESEEENDGERDIDEDGEGGWEYIDKLDFRDL